MLSQNAQIAQRIEAHKAVAHLESVAEYFPIDEGEQLQEWEDKIKEFKDWLWHESPIV